MAASVGEMKQRGLKYKTYSCCAYAYALRTVQPTDTPQRRAQDAWRTHARHLPPAPAASDRRERRCHRVTKLQIGSSRVARIFVRSRRVSAGKLLDDRAAARVVTEVGGRVKYAASDDDPASKLRGVLADNAPAGLVVIGCTAAAAARGLHSSLAGRPPPLASAVGGLEPLVLRRGRQNRRGSMLLILQRT